MRAMAPANLIILKGGGGGESLIGQKKANFQ